MKLLVYTWIENITPGERYAYCVSFRKSSRKGEGEGASIYKIFYTNKYIKITSDTIYTKIISYLSKRLHVVISPKND